VGRRVHQSGTARFLDPVHAARMINRQNALHVGRLRVSSGDNACEISLPVWAAFCQPVGSSSR
jgi:hypothetical protein